MDAAQAPVPSSDEEEANVAKGTNAVNAEKFEELRNEMRILMDRMEQMQYENKALQNKLSARDAHITNLIARTEKAEDELKSMTIIKPMVYGHGDTSRHLEKEVC
mgnify:CR=1 FL=1